MNEIVKTVYLRLLSFFLFLKTYLIWSIAEACVEGTIGEGVGEREMCVGDWGE